MGEFKPNKPREWVLVRWTSLSVSTCLEIHARKTYRNMLHVNYQLHLGWKMGVYIYICIYL